MNFELPGDIVAPWDDMVPAHPHIPTLSKLRTFVLKYLDSEQAAEILVVMRSLLDKTGGRLTGLKTLHLGDISGSPEWEEAEQSLVPLTVELQKILPVPSEVRDGENALQTRGLTALSITGMKDRFECTDRQLVVGGIKDGLKSLASLSVFNTVTSLRLMFCESFIFDAIKPQLDQDARLPMPKLSGLWLEKCEGSGNQLVWNRTSLSPYCSIAPLLEMVIARKAKTECSDIRVIGYAHRDSGHVSQEAVGHLRSYVDCIAGWGRDEGEVPDSPIDGPISQEEEDERLIREAEEMDDPEFDYYCDLILRKQEQDVDEGEDSEMEDGENEHALMGAPLPIPVLMSNEMVEDDELTPEEALPTPRNPYQTFFDADLLASYHRYITGEDLDVGIRSSHGEIYGSRVVDGADVDCGASTSTHPSTTLSSPSSSTFSLPTSTAPSEAASVCGDPGSDDTAFQLTMEKVGVRYNMDTDLELDTY